MLDKSTLEQIKPGAQVRVHEVIREKKLAKGEASKSRTSIFSGIVLARKHGKEPGATFTVRTQIAREGVEKIYPIHSPLIGKVEIISSPKKVHRAKLYYLRGISKKEIRRKVGV